MAAVGVNGVVMVVIMPLALSAAGMVGNLLIAVRIVALAVVLVLVIKILAAGVAAGVARVRCGG